MTTDRDPAFDPRIAGWLEDDPTDAPVAVLETVLAAFPSIPQRRPSRLPWRLSPMSTPLRLAGAALGAVILVAAAVSLLGRSTSQVGTSTPTPIATASPTPAPTSRVPGAVQIREGMTVPTGGTVTTSLFSPPFTIAGVASLNLDGEGPGRAWFTYGSNAGLLIVDPVHVIEVGGAVSPVPADLVAWLKARSDLTISRTAAIDLGGISGTLLEGVVNAGAPLNKGNAINIACAADRACAFENGDEFGLGSTDHFEFVVVVVRGQTLLLGITAASDAAAGGAWAASHAALEAILGSIRFPAVAP